MLLGPRLLLCKMGVKPLLSQTTWGADVISSHYQRSLTTDHRRQLSQGSAKAKAEEGVPELTP